MKITKNTPTHTRPQNGPPSSCPKNKAALVTFLIVGLLSNFGCKKDSSPKTRENSVTAEATDPRTVKQVDVSTLQQLVDLPAGPTHVFINTGNLCDLVQDPKLWHGKSPLAVDIGGVTAPSVDCLMKLPVNYLDLGVTDVDITWLGEIVKKGDLVSLDLNSGKPISKSELAMLSDLPLKELGLTLSTPSEWSVDALRRMSKLRKLRLILKTCDDDTARLIGQYPALYELDVSRTKIGTHGLQSIAHSPGAQGIERLGLFRTKIGSLNAIRHFPRLRWLEATGIPLASGGLIEVRAPQLKTLLMLDVDVYDKGLSESLGRLPSLEILMLSRTKISKETIDAISRLSSLETLTLYLVQFEGSAATLGRLASLKTLRVVDTNATDVDVAGWTMLKNIERLDIQGTKISEVGLEHVSRMKLQHLAIPETRVSSRVIKKLATNESLKSLGIPQTLALPGDDYFNSRWKKRYGFRDKVTILLYR